MGVLQLTPPGLAAAFDRTRLHRVITLSLLDDERESFDIKYILAHIGCAGCADTSWHAQGRHGRVESPGLSALTGPCRAGVLMELITRG